MTILLIGLAVLALVIAVALVTAPQWRAGRYGVQEKWGLTDQEAARYARDLPEVEREIAASVPKGQYSRREIREMAEQSTLKAVLLKRVPKPDGDL